MKRRFLPNQALLGRATSRGLIILTSCFVAVAAIVAGCVQQSLPQKQPSQSVDTSNKTKVTPSDSNYSYYSNNNFGISFNYIKGGVLSEREYESENLSEIELYYDQLSRIFITYELNPNEFSPREWFQANRNKFNKLIVDLGETDIQGNPALFLGLPDTCASAPLIVSIIIHGDRIFTLTHFEYGSRAYAEELEQVLQSISFGGEKRAPQIISREHIKFPKPPPDISCP